MDSPVAAVTLVAVLAGTSVLAVAARRFHRPRRLPDLEGWALADRRFGAPMTWVLLGGSVFTAYTFIAVPALTYGVGALGFFTLAYTVMLAPILYVLLPRLWSAVRRSGSVTVADWVKRRWGSSALASAVVVTGLLATMPYIALQLVGVRAVLTAGGLYPDGMAGDLALTVVFAVLAGATFNSGLRAPALLAVVKAALVFGAALGTTAAVLGEFGGFGPMFDAGRSHAANVALLLRPDQYVAFATLAIGSVLALPMYPHVQSATFAAASPDVVRRAVIGIPAWTVVLGLFGLLGIAAMAAGISAPAGNAEVAAPMLIAGLLPELAGGLVFGALSVGALVPAAVMSVAVATLFARNVFVEYFAPTATPKSQLRVARWVSLLAKVAALAFVFGLREQTAIDLQLLGSLWAVQLLPTVVLGLATPWAHPRALLVGWFAGMAAGTWLAVSGGFSSIIVLGSLPISVAVVALVLNVLVVGLVSLPVGRRWRSADRNRSVRSVVGWS